MSKHQFSVLWVPCDRRGLPIDRYFKLIVIDLREVNLRNDGVMQHLVYMRTDYDHIVRRISTSLTEWNQVVHL